MTKRNAVIIYNPKSAAHKTRDRAIEVAAYSELLAQREIEAEPWPTTGPSDASRLARQAISQGIDLVIASGGDGTLNEVLQGMAGSTVPLGIWPGGTANVLAHDLHLPSDPYTNANLMAEGEHRRITVGLAGDRYFFLMAGIGLDAMMVKGVDPKLKAKLGEGAYWVSAMKHLVTHPQVFTVEVDGIAYETAFAIVGNSRGYGGGFSLTPNANIFDPNFDVCIFPAKDYGFKYLPYALSSFFGDPSRPGNVISLRTKFLTAFGLPDKQPWVQVDGELLGPLPMRFEAIPDALTLIVPK